MYILLFLHVFCRKPFKCCYFCKLFAENLINIAVFEREHGPSTKPGMEPAGIRVSTLRFPFPRSHSLENPSTKGCGKNLPGPIWGFPRHCFCVGRKTRKKNKILHIFLGGPMGTVHPVWDHLVTFGWAGRHLARNGGSYGIQEVHTGIQARIRNLLHI